MLFEIILNCFFLWMTFDSLNQVMNANALMRAFHRRIGNTGDVEINVLVVHRKVELIRIITWRCSEGRPPQFHWTSFAVSDDTEVCTKALRCWLDFSQVSRRDGAGARGCPDLNLGGLQLKVDGECGVRYKVYGGWYQSSRYAHNLAQLSRVRWVWVRMYRDMWSTTAAKPQGDSGQPWCWP